MICIKTEIPKEICEIDDESKGIYDSEDSIYIWLFENRNYRNRFMKETVGMLKKERSAHYLKFYL